MKKIAVLMVLMLLMSLAAVPVSAEGIEIVSPAASIEAGENEFSVISDAPEIKFELDGRLLDGTQSQIEVPEELLYVGEHKLCVYAIYADGSVVTAEKEFSVYKELRDYQFNVDFEDFNGEFPAGMKAEHHSPAYSETALATGPKGEGDKALSFSSVCQFDVWGAPYLQFALSEPYPDDVFVLEYDIKFSTNTDCIWHEFKNGSNSFFVFKQKGCFDTNGKITDTDVEYNTSNFYHVKIVQDFKGDTLDMYIDDALVKHIDNRTDLDADATGVDIFRLCMTSPTSPSGAGYVIDNIQIYETTKFTGISSVSEDDGTISVFLNEKMTESSVNTSNVTVKDGDTIVASQISYISDENKIEIVPQKALNGEIEIEVGKDTKLENGKPVSVSAKAKLIIGNTDISDKKPEIYCNGIKCISQSQLKSGVEISAKVKTNFDTQRDVLMIIYARNNGKLVGFKALTQTVAAGEDEATITSTLTENCDSATAVLLDSWSDSKAISKPMLIK